MAPVLQVYCRVWVLCYFLKLYLPFSNWSTHVKVIPPRLLSLNLNKNVPGVLSLSKIRSFSLLTNPITYLKCNRRSWVYFWKKIQTSICAMYLAKLYIGVQRLVTKALWGLEMMTKASCDLHVEYGIKLKVLWSMMKFITVLDCTPTEMINLHFWEIQWCCLLAKISKSYKWEEGDRSIKLFANSLLHS